MKIVVIDAQGGGVGKSVISALNTPDRKYEIIAVGTNSAAASAMLKSGADKAAVGENAVIVNCRDADIIVGAIGIVIADSMLGEISPAMSVAVAQSRAEKVLIPFSHGGLHLIGQQNHKLSESIEEAAQTVFAIIAKKQSSF
ncbi:MAG: DUF3842 family protein [Erysipelotrichaceae bacterium]|nr:DUF3842 family protein [Erysipelotrichaceae bacterium]